MAENKIDPKFNIHSNYTKVNILNPYRFAVGASYEPETLNYIAAVGIADDSTVYYAGTPQEITGNGFYLAIDTFVKSLKTEGIFSKLKAVYPFIGGTADRHKWNLINPQDTNEAHRMVFYGSGVHSATGWKNDGLSGYCDTNLNQLNHSELNNESLGIYSRINTNLKEFDISLSSSFKSELKINWVNTTYTISQNSSIQFLQTTTNSLGLFTINRVNSMEYYLSHNESYQLSGQMSNALGNSNFLIGWDKAWRNASTKEYSYAFISEGLTESEMTAHYNAVQQLQTDLGRAV